MRLAFAVDNTVFKLIGAGAFRLVWSKSNRVGTKRIPVVDWSFFTRPLLPKKYQEDALQCLTATGPDREHKRGDHRGRDL